MTLKRWSYLIGISMVAILILSAILPLIAPNNINTPQQRVEPTPAPTLPPPPDLSAITFDQIYLHPSGLFTVAEPSGWLPSQPITASSNARAVFSNSTAQSVIQVDIDRPTVAEEGPLTLDNVDALFNQSWLSASWRQYSRWEESSRIRTEDERLVIDFALTSNNQTYVARQTAWTDGEWIYSVRVVMPQNATEALLFLLDNVAATLQPQKEFATTPFDWKAYFDPQDAHIIRYPSNWTLADSAPGKPASIEGTNGTLLRVEAVADTVISSADDARAWVENLRGGASVLSVESISRDETEGFAVAYSYRTVDGDPASGLAVLLNGADNKLHVANLRFPGSEIDLNADTVSESYTDLVALMNSFTLRPDLVGVQTQ
jgi:hypothetical protein